jgi:hypothetical protein
VETNKEGTMRMIYSLETKRGPTTQYHGHAITPEDVTLTLGEAEALIDRFISAPTGDAHVTEGVIHSEAPVVPGVYIGSGMHNRKLADLVIVKRTEKIGGDWLKLYAVDTENGDAFFIKDI